MKLNRLLIASLLGFSLLTTSALACEHSSGSSSNQESHWSFFGWNHHTDQDHERQADHNGQDSGQGHNCDRGKGNGGGYCSTTGGSTSGGSTGGSTTAGGGKGIS